MENMDSTNEELQRPVRPLIRSLRYMGLWPYPTKTVSSANWLMYTFYTIVFQIVFTFAYDAFKCINFLFITDLTIITRAMFVCLTELSLAIKVVNFYLRLNTMQNCLTWINTIQLYGDAEHALFKRRLAFMSRIFVWFLVTANMTGVFSYLSPMLIAEPVLPYPGWYPLDWYHKSLDYWIVFTYQCAGMFFQIQTLVVIEVFFVYLMVVVSAYMEIIGARIRSIGYENNTESTIQRETDSVAENSLKDCIKLHRDVLKFSSTIETAGSIPYFIQFFLSGIVLCVSVFQIAIINPREAIPEFAFYVGFVCTMLLQIFLPCYFGNEILLNSEQLLTDLYSSDWPNQSKRYRSLVLVFMEILKQPKKVIVGQLFSLTLDSFLSVLNKAYSLYAVLQSFNE